MYFVSVRVSKSWFERLNEHMDERMMKVEWPNEHGPFKFERIGFRFFLSVVRASRTSSGDHGLPTLPPRRGCFF
jgi:hypothetical protein